MTDLSEKIGDIIKRHESAAAPAIDPSKAEAVQAAEAKMPADTGQAQQSLKDKVLGIINKPPMHVPELQHPDRNDTAQGLEDMIKRGLPRGEATPDKVGRVKEEIQGTLNNTLKIISVLATGNVSFDFSGIRNLIAYKFNVNIPLEYAALFNAFVSNIPENILRDFLRDKNIDNHGLLKRLCVMDLFAPYAQNQAQLLPNVLTREPLSSVVAYMSYIMPNVHKDMSRSSSHVIRIESGQPLEKGAIEERTEGVLLAMLNNPNSKLLIRRVTNLGELKQLMVIDELLEYLKSGNVNFDLDYFLRPSVDIDGIHLDLGTKLKEVLYNPSAPGGNTVADLRRLHITANLCTLFDDERAVTFYEDLVRRDPTNEFAVIDFVRFLYSRGKFDKALAACNSFLKIKKSKAVLEEKSRIFELRGKRGKWLASVSNSLSKKLCDMSVNSLEKKWRRERADLEDVLRDALADPNINITPLLRSITSDGPTLNTLMDIADTVTATRNKDYFDGAYHVVLRASRLSKKNERCIYELGRIALERGWYDVAISHLKHLKRAFKDSRLLLGMAYYGERDFKKALKTLDVWLKESPNDLRGLKYRGHTRMELKQFNFARGDYVTALRIQPSGDVHFNMGSIELSKKDLQTAAMHFEKSANLNYNKQESLINAAKCYYASGAYDRARERLQSALEVSNNSDALFLICKVLNRLKNNDDHLIDYCNRVLAMQPQNEDIIKIKEGAIMRNAERARQQKDYGKASELLEGTIVSNPDNSVEPHRNMLDVLWQRFQSGDRTALPEIIPHADSILRTNKRDTFALHYKALAQKELGLADIASTLEAILQYAPEYDFALKELGNVRLAGGDYRGAIELYERFIHHEDKDVDVLNNLSSAYCNLGDFEKALRYVRLAKLRESSEGILSNEVAILSRLGRYDEVAITIDRAIKEGKKLSNDLYFVRARLLQASGDKKSLEKAYELYEYLTSGGKELNSEWLARHAEVALQLGQNQKAMNSLDALIAADKSDPNIHMMRAQAVLGIGNYSAEAKSAAVKEFYSALHIMERTETGDGMSERTGKPKQYKFSRPELCKQLGQLLYDLSRFDEIIDVLARNNVPREEDVAKLLLNAHRNLKDDDSILLVAKEIVSNQNISAGLRGIAYTVLGDMSDVGGKAEFYRNATILSPGPSVFYKYAISLRDSGRLEDALTACMRARTLGSKESAQLEKEISMQIEGARWNKKGDDAMLAGNYKEAIAHYDDAIDSIGATIELLRKKANAEDKAKRPDSALATLEKLMAQGDVDAALQRADLLFNSQNYDGAIVCYDDVLAKDPDNTAAIYGKANSLFDRGDFIIAASIAKDACQQGSKDIRMWFLAGLSNEKQEKYLEAIEHYRGCAGLKPDKSVLETILTNTGNCFFALKKFPEAKRAYEHALKTNGNSAYALCGLAELHIKTGKLDTALDYIDKAIILEPKEIYHKQVKIKILDALNKPVEAASIIMEIENAAAE